MAHFFERPDGLQRGKIFEQLYFHASGLSPAFLQAFMVAIQSSPEPEAQARALSEVERVPGVLAMGSSNRRRWEETIQLAPADGIVVTALATPGRGREARRKGAPGDLQK
jgi:hypothetical protein